MRKFFVFLLFLFFLTAIRGAAAQTVPPSVASIGSPAEKLVLPGIHNAGKVSDNLFRGAQPDPASFSVLKNLGVTTIVDLRAESPEIIRKEHEAATALGLRFVNIPVGGFATPTDAQMEEFFSLLRETPAPIVFVHCEYGRDRTGTFVAAYRMAFQNWTADQAVTEMMTFGFHRMWHPAMEHYVQGFRTHLQNTPALKSAAAPR
jgi:tyrosine-protein phosphatase SIW14